MNGKIQKLVKDRLFGFIAPAEGGKDIFFHAEGLNGIRFEELNDGDLVTFETEESDRGPKAINVARA